MTAWDCDQIFLMYERLLVIYEPAEARAWLRTPQKRLGDRRPCELIENPMTYQHVTRLITRLIEDADEEAE